MTPILTDDQILACLSQTGDRQAMLQAAARMGMMRAAEICDDVSIYEYGLATPIDCRDAIRAAAEANPPPREPSPKS